MFSTYALIVTGCTSCLPINLGMRIAVQYELVGAINVSIHEVRVMCNYSEE